MGKRNMNRQTDIHKRMMRGESIPAYRPPAQLEPLDWHAGIHPDEYAAVIREAANFLLQLGHWQEAQTLRIVANGLDQ